MIVTSVPIKEVDGVASGKTLLAEHNSHLQVCSHKDQALITLRFLSRTITLEASKLQAAIQGVVNNGSSANGAAAAI